MRRAWTRYLLENGIREKSRVVRVRVVAVRRKRFSASLHSAALRAIQKQSSAADAPGSTPEMHLDVAQLCHDYLASTDEAIKSGSFGSEKGIAIARRSGTRARSAPASLVDDGPGRNRSL